MQLRWLQVDPKMLSIGTGLICQGVPQMNLEDAVDIKPGFWILQWRESDTDWWKNVEREDVM